VDSDHKIAKIKGDLTAFGFDIATGSKAGESFTFLETLLPFKYEKLQLDCVQTPNNLYINVHLEPYQNGLFIFIHNVTEQAYKLQEMQQNRNELCLTINRVKDLLFELNY